MTERLSTTAPQDRLDRYVEQFRRSASFTPSQPIFMDSAGSSLPDPDVVQTITEHLTLEATVGGYEAARLAEPQLDRFYDSAAALLNADRAGIAYVDSGTRAWNSIIYATLNLGPGDEIITAPSEFGSNLVSLAHLAQQTGASIRLARVDGFGVVDRDHLHDLITERTRLVALSLVNAHLGTVNNLDGVGQQLREKSPGALFVADASQAVGQVPVEVDVLGADAVTATGRKWLRGPRGSGFLYIDPNRVEQFGPANFDQIVAGLESADTYPNTALSIRPDARRFEMWERSHATMLGLGKAIDIALDLGIKHINERVTNRASQLRLAINRIDGLRCLEEETAGTGIVGVASDNRSVWDLVASLDTAGIRAGGMPRWNTGPAFDGESHQSVLRLSPHFFNTAQEVEQVIERLNAE